VQPVSPTLAQVVSQDISLSGSVVPKGAIALQPSAQPANLPIQEKQEGSSLDFRVCAEVPTWERSPEQTHIKQLQENPRYGDAIHEEPLKSLLQEFRSHNVVSFTTYGLSARIEPLYLSGIWTAMDELWPCYEEGQPDQMNNGQMAELWLLNHRIRDIQWTGGSYMVTVDPSDQGFQVVQFDRQESQPQLSLQVITPNGTQVPTLSGDW
jgi:hypothetical protein